MSKRLCELTDHHKMSKSLDHPLIPEPDMEEFFLPPVPLQCPVAVKLDHYVDALEDAFFRCNLVSRDEFDGTRSEMDRYEEHFSKREDHIDCPICAYYRTCRFVCFGDSGRCSPTLLEGNIVSEDCGSA